MSWLNPPYQGGYPQQTGFNGQLQPQPTGYPVRSRSSLPRLAVTLTLRPTAAGGLRATAAAAAAATAPVPGKRFPSRHRRSRSSPSVLSRHRRGGTEDCVPSQRATLRCSSVPSRPATLRPNSSRRSSATNQRATPALSPPTNPLSPPAILLSSDLRFRINSSPLSSPPRTSSQRRTWTPPACSSPHHSKDLPSSSPSSNPTSKRPAKRPFPSRGLSPKTRRSATIRSSAPGISKATASSGVQSRRRSLVKLDSNETISWIFGQSCSSLIATTTHPHATGTWPMSLTEGSSTLTNSMSLWD